ncbi:unnamed protein product [Prorocentrum cordatum]|uniref:Uncharacterized protein n=1 Tax=Prorocentrum cordatum TaxID=2364126 RepID=A0ABN9VQZ7_9DINO|nr:unnamed protein product [Polarella glacialis]
MPADCSCEKAKDGGNAMTMETKGREAQDAVAPNATGGSTKQQMRELSQMFREHIGEAVKQAVSAGSKGAIRHALGAAADSEASDPWEKIDRWSRRVLGRQCAIGTGRLADRFLRRVVGLLGSRGLEPD